MTTDTLHGAVPVPLEPITFGPPRDVVSDVERAHSYRSPIVLRDPAPGKDKPTPPKRPANSGSYRSKPITEEERADILARYTAGQSRASIGIAVHRGDVVVDRVITQAGLPLRNDSGGNRRARTDGHIIGDKALAARIAELAPRVAQLYGAGLSMQQTATVLGVNVAVVRRAMATHGIPTRPSTRPDHREASA